MGRITYGWNVCRCIRVSPSFSFFSSGMLSSTFHYPLDVSTLLHRFYCEKTRIDTILPNGFRRIRACHLNENVFRSIYVFVSITFFLRFSYQLKFASKCLPFHNCLLYLSPRTFVCSLYLPCSSIRIKYTHFLRAVTILPSISHIIVFFSFFSRESHKKAHVATSTTSNLFSHMTIWRKQWREAMEMKPEDKEEVFLSLSLSTSDDHLTIIFF